MDFEPGSYTITGMDSGAPVGLGVNVLPGLSPVVVLLGGNSQELATTFEIARAESDGQYTMTSGGANVVVSDGGVFTSSSVAEVWQFVPQSDSSEGVYS